jgi:hypothetical protein
MVWSCGWWNFLKCIGTQRLSVSPQRYASRLLVGVWSCLSEVHCATGSVLDGSLMLGTEVLDRGRTADSSGLFTSGVGSTTRTRWFDLGLLGCKWSSGSGRASDSGR